MPLLSTDVRELLIREQQVYPMDLSGHFLSHMVVSNKLWDHLALCGCTWNSLQLTDSSLGSCKFRRAFWEQLSWINTNGEYLDFANADIRNGAISRSEFSCSNFEGTNFKNVVLRGVKFFDCVFIRSCMYGISFRNCEFSGCRFADMDWECVTFDECGFVGCGNLRNLGMGSRFANVRITNQGCEPLHWN